MTSSPSKRKRSRKVSSELNSEASVPSVAEEEFRTVIGSSVVDQFVAGHSLSDVLRELVQNEYDAGGNKLTITFGDNALRISGNGKPIDASGWLRLSAILGTGRVIGDGNEHDDIVPKENGIGSKNFGLRSLFLIGNRIYIRSNGKLAVLDLPKMGTQALSDHESRGQRGVHIYVPLRDEPFHGLGAFSQERERDALNLLGHELLPTLIKLVLTGQKTGIERVDIHSERSKQRLSWKQSAKSVSCRLKGVSCLRRIGRLRHTSSADRTDKQRSYEELEFSRIVPIPVEFSDIKFPPYFRARGGVKICVSLPIRKTRIDRTRRGTFFYPLSATETDTGTNLNVNAPFDLDSDRSKLIESDWNGWLSVQAARLASDLIIGDWYKRFGADAYLAINPGVGKPIQFADAIRDHLSNDACWPTRARKGRSPLFVNARDIVVSAHPTLDKYLSREKYLDDGFAAHLDAIDMVLKYGAKTFSLNSLVRLRCAPEDSSQLETNTDDDADYYYSDYEEELRGEDLQIRFAEALGHHSRRLSNQNRRDLKITASTLAADRSLQAAGELIRVEPSMWNACPVAASQRLHPKLFNHKTIARLCQPFDVNTWIQGLADQAAKGEIPGDDQEALYSYLVNSLAPINRTTFSAIKRSPVVKDHRGDWVSPNGLVHLPNWQFDKMEPVLSAPSPELIGSRALFKRLQVRQKLRGGDLIAMAEHVVDHPEHADHFEQLLTRQLPLLTRQTVKRLRAIAFLRSRAGTLARPEDLHLAIPVNEACLDDTAQFVAGTNHALYRRLNCRSYPACEALLHSLERRREYGQEITRPDVFYSALVGGLRNEGSLPTKYEDDPILYVQGAYHAPSQTLVGSHIPRYFRLGLPHFTGSKIQGDSYVLLGASNIPKERHWERLLRWFAGERSNNDEVLSGMGRRSLKDAYGRLGRSGLPDGLDDELQCLLSEDGTLHSLRELREGTYLENDYPELATALRKGGTRISFADIESNTISFFQHIGLQKLSQACGVHLHDIGDECEPPAWFLSRCERSFKWIRKGEFAAALSDLAWSHYHNNGGFEPIDRKSLERRLAQVEDITCVTSIMRVHRLAGIDVSVPSDAAMMEDRIAIARPRQRADFDHMLAFGLAEAVGALRIFDMRTFSNCIFALLKCRSKAEMSSYLKRQGIQPGKWSHKEYDFEEPDTSPDDIYDSTEDIVSNLVENLSLGETLENAKQSNNQPKGSGAPAPSSSPTPRGLLMPPIENVQLRQMTRSRDRVVSNTAYSSGGGSAGSWHPPTSRDVDRDKQVGERGEELIYLQELDRVRSLDYGAPENLVIWTSKSEPGADHDIRSVDEDGEPLWIEVKSTTGTDGHFEWSSREFGKALRSGNNYVLWRVYQADTAQPTAKCFRNPVSLLGSTNLRLQLGNVRATVEPLDAGALRET